MYRWLRSHGFRWIHRLMPEQSLQLELLDQNNCSG
jgi:hypothetical protein